MSLLLSVVFVFFTLVARAYAQNKTSLPTAWYKGLSSDSSGSYLTAITIGGPLYYSTDSGVSWKVSDAPNPADYNAVAASSTGQYVIATTTNATLVSSDYGQHFKKAADIYSLPHSVAVSGTGQYMVSISIYASSKCLAYSNNYGVSFTLDLGPTAGCTSVAIDTIGTYVVLSVYGSGLWVSNNVTDASSWKLTYETEARIDSIAFGGANFYAGYWSSPASVVQSTDYGYTWTVKGSVPNRIYSMAVDSTGVNVLIASELYLYLTQDSGSTYESLYSAFGIFNCAMNGDTTLAVFTATPATDQSEFDVYIGNPCKNRPLYVSLLHLFIFFLQWR